MELKTAKTCFIISTIMMFVVFIVLTIWTLQTIPARTKADQLLENPQIVEGKKVWQKYACVDCHTILGNGAYFAPDLTKVYQVRGEKWLQQWLSNPLVMDKASLMPNLHIKSDEVPKLIAFLKWVNNVNTSGWPPAPLKKVEAKPSLQKGEELFTKKGCDGCHMLKGAGTVFGPDLTKIGLRRNKDWLERWLRDPKSVKPDTIMPKPDLTDQERTSLIEFLSSQK